MTIDLPYNLFQGQTVTIVGGGPSLKGFDFSRIQQPAIGINYSVEYHDSVMLVAIDRMFHKKERSLVDSYMGYKVTCNETEDRSFIKATLDPDYHNRNLDWHVMKVNLSGYFALALALQLRAFRVFLLGFDGGYDTQAPRFHGHAYKGLKTGDYYNVNRYYDFFHGKPVVNVGLDSKIKCFTRLPLNSNFYEYRAVRKTEV